ncbi:MAG TPA: AraC family transcriptional regulator [Vicinamibacterales bacterium]|nr:AraC family transcriptional regulator [Vicinamibacterales bacterium]
MDDRGLSQPPAEFSHGTILRWRRVPGLVLGEVEYAADQRVPLHDHSNGRFVLVLRGRIVETRGSDSITHTANTLLYRQPRERHAYRVGPKGAACLIVDMDAAWVQRAASEAPVLTKSATLTGGLVVHLAQRLHGEFGLRDEVSRLAIESLALGVLAEASRRIASTVDREAPGWVREARAFVDANVAERLALATVAALVGVHPVHLARTFKRVYHTTFAAYVRTTRLEFARDELARTRKPLSEIAAASGFCDQSHFSRLFKAHTGLTPHEYRLAAAR